jgi:hypothetical protein
MFNSKNFGTKKWRQKMGPGSIFSQLAIKQKMGPGSIFSKGKNYIQIFCLSIQMLLKE